jgi:NAD(P)-dependent dehydrogenase (short-subunit alcohol dehydrogenase family)
MSKRLIVLTGATRGCGRALVDRFVEAGHRVIGCGRSEDGIIELHLSIQGSSSFSVVNVADWDQVKIWSQAVLGQHGVPDLVINNAALMNQPAPLWEVSDAEFDRLLQVNLAGPANLVRAFAPAMIEAGRGVFVNFSSGWGKSTSPGVGPYCTTKYGIEGFSSALADDLPEGLASVAFSPGVINTEMLQSCFGDAAAEHWQPEAWSQRAAGAILALGPRDNGRSMRLE